MSAESIRVMHPLFQAEQGGSTPTSALQLRVDVVDAVTAVQLNKLWHSRLPYIHTANIYRNTHYRCFAVRHIGTWYAVAIWTSPVSRLLNGKNWLELRRFAIAPDAPKNTASRVLGVMARKIKKEMPSIVRLISYQDEDVHTGTIYRAAGWTPVVVPGRHCNWAGDSRRKRVKQAPGDKVRWEKELSATIQQ